MTLEDPTATPRAAARGWRVAIVTTTRADYGILHWLISEVHRDPDLQLLLYVTGAHLVRGFGHTVDQISADGLPIARCIPILAEEDSPLRATDAVGAAASGFGRAFHEDQPDLVVLLGDRYEIVPIALASVLHSAPVAHLHGGELSAGALDEYFRHAVTKLATLHFPATHEYSRRLLQLGEPADRVHVVGAPALDHVHRTELLSREELERTLDLKLDRPTALVTYHPVTTQPGASVATVERIAAALLAEEPLQAVFTKANADAEGHSINLLLAELARQHPSRFHLFDNLGSRNFLSCLRHFDLMLGNSSSGLIEAPAFELPVVNVGSRQDGRTRAQNVIDVGTEVSEIREGIRRATSPEFRARLTGMSNPYDAYGDGDVAGRIVATIKEFLAERNSLRKVFVDRPVGGTDA